MFLKIPKNRQKLSGFCLFFVSLGSRTPAGGFPGSGSCLDSHTLAGGFPGLVWAAVPLREGFRGLVWAAIPLREGFRGLV